MVVDRSRPGSRRARADGLRSEPQTTTPDLPIVALQQTIGNRAVNELLQRHPHDRPEDDHPFGDQEHEHVERKLVYKGVADLRLKTDLGEDALPVGVRVGSATAVMQVRSGRPATPLDQVTLWFGEETVARDYCKSHAKSILLRINVEGHQLLAASNSYYTFTPVPWDQVEYLNKAGEWVSLADRKMPRDAKDISDADEDEEEAGEDW
jgi:hypothetical protein